MTANSKFTYYLFIGIFIAAVVVSLLYYVFNRGIFADVFSDRGEVVDQLSYSYDLDDKGTDETILITKYRQDDGTHDHYIEIENNYNLFSKLEGFELDVTFCDQEVIKLDDKNLAICVSGFVGAHSKNLQLVSYQSSGLSFYQYIKGEIITNNIYTDSPNFTIYDYNDDKKSDLIIDYRDYEKNPLVDITRMYYYFDADSGFVYDQLEEINQSSSDLGEQGQIN